MDSFTSKSFVLLIFDFMFLFLKIAPQICTLVSDLVVEVFVDRKVEKSHDLVIGGTSNDGFLLRDFSILIGVELVHDSFSKRLTITLSFHHLTDGGNISSHFVGINVTILVFVIGSEGP